MLLRYFSLDWEDQPIINSNKLQAALEELDTQQLKQCQQSQASATSSVVAQSATASIQPQPLPPSPISFNYPAYYRKHLAQGQLQTERQVSIHTFFKPQTETKAQNESRGVQNPADEPITFASSSSSSTDQSSTHSTLFVPASSLPGAFPPSSLSSRPTSTAPSIKGFFLDPSSSSSSSSAAAAGISTSPSQSQSQPQRRQQEANTDFTAEVEEIERIYRQQQEQNTSGTTAAAAASSTSASSSNQHPLSPTKRLTVSSPASSARKKQKTTNGGTTPTNAAAAGLVSITRFFTTPSKKQ